MRTTSLVILYFLVAYFGGLGENQLLGQNNGPGIPEIVNFDKYAYQGGTQNWSIVQDSAGVLYVGNNKGVLLFDGTYWQRLPLPNHTIVRSLFKDADDRIWVGGQDELGWLVRDEIGQVQYKSLVHLLPEEERSFEDVWSISKYHAKTYFCTRSALFVFDGKAFSVVRPKGSFEHLFRVQDRLFILDLASGLLELQNGSFQLIPGGEQLLDKQIASLLPLNNDDLLIVTHYAGLYRMSGNEVQAWETPSSSFFRENQAYCGLRVGDDRFAIGTVQNGLLLMDSAGNPLAHYNEASGLQNNSILSLTEDNYGNLWLGLDNGLDYLKYGTPFSLVEEDSGVAGTGYCAAIHDDKLLLGTNRGLYQVEWPVKPEPFRPKALATQTNLKTQIWNFSTIEEALFIHTHEGTYEWQPNGLRLVSPRHGSWRFLPLTKAPDYMVEGGYNGLFLYHKQGDKWQYLRPLAGFEESARVIEQDAKGDIWVSHAYKGLFRIHLNEALEIEEVRFFGTDDGLPTTININVVKINEELFFTTSQGVYQYDAANDQFVVASRMEELLGPSANVRRLVAENDERLWFVLEDELGFLQVAPNGILTDQLVEKRYLNALKGKLVDGFEQVFTLGQGQSLLATEDGFLNYCHTCFADRDLAFNVLIRKVEATKRGSGQTTPAPVEIKHEVGMIRLPANTENIRITFAAPFFEDLSGLVYRHRLRGFQDQWSDWSSRTEKEYGNLLKGSYRFEVQAKNAYGQLSSVVTEPFSIAAPWYASGVAKAIYITLALGSLLLVYRLTTLWAVQEREQVIEAQAAQLAQTEAEFKQQKEESTEEIVRLRNENLQADIRHRNSQLAAATMHLVQKGEVLQKIRKDLEKLKPKLPSENRRPLQQLINTIDANSRLDENWQQFEAHFDQVHENFLKNLRDAYPHLTPKDQRLCAYLRMNLSTKEIAPLMNISVRGVEISRYRLRKKLSLDTETNLTDFIMRL